ncbi:Pex12 amino terminal region-domain-containing protein [Gautieria morchelliformis]|nr:Pex12 amino terminal region-domain-containing protein [Gautieria morchelliformis]
MSSLSWQQAWDLAQPRLQAIRQSLPTFPHATPRVLRVGQLDAELLDQELLQILTDPLAKAIGLVKSSYRSRFDPELKLLVHIILYKFSVWDLGATYGAKLQNLRYEIPITPMTGNLTPSGLPPRTLWAHAAATILIPYLHSRIRVYALSRAWPDAPSFDVRRRGWTALMRIESAHHVLSLASFIVFLCDGRYRTWADRLLRLRLVPSQSNSTRQVSYEFMNRQMVWHAFTEFLLFLLPLINTRVLRRRMRRAASNISRAKIIPSFVRQPLGKLDVPGPTDKEEAVERRGKYWSLPEDQCAICAEDASFSITDPRHDMYTFRSLTEPSSSQPARSDDSPRFPLQTPYITSCLHQYCYVCVSERMLRAADEGEPAWECLRCVAMVLSADRVDADTAQEARTNVDVDLDEASLKSEDFLTTRSE